MGGVGEKPALVSQIGPSEAERTPDAARLHPGGMQRWQRGLAYGALHLSSRLLCGKCPRAAEALTSHSHLHAFGPS